MLLMESPHQIRVEVRQPPRQGMRSSADSLDKKRFIGEHRGELKRSGGRGEPGAHAVARTPALTEELRITHLAAWLTSEEKNSSLLLVHNFLIPTCMTCFEQEALQVPVSTAPGSRFITLTTLHSEKIYSLLCGEISKLLPLSTRYLHDFFLKKRKQRHTFCFKQQPPGRCYMDVIFSYIFMSSYFLTVPLSIDIWGTVECFCSVCAVHIWLLHSGWYLQAERAIKYFLRPVTNYPLAAGRLFQCQPVPARYSKVIALKNCVTSHVYF